MRPSIPFGFAATLAIACIMHPSSARADNKLKPSRGAGGTFWFQLDGSYMSNGPSLSVSDVATSARPNINGSTPPFGFASGYFGERSGFDLVFADHTILPIMDIGLYGAVGSYSDVITTADGTFFKLHPAGAFMVDFEFLGIGFRFKRRRWMFEGTIKPGVAIYATPAGVADGKGFTDVDPLNSATFTLRASLSVCRRFDPLERLCASVTPNIYQWGWGNGGSVGLRWEFGS